MVGKEKGRRGDPTGQDEGGLSVRKRPSNKVSTRF